MNKQGQFYLVAVMILIVFFIGLATIPNYIQQPKITGLKEVETEINIEVRNVLDYIYTQRLNGADTKIILTNFSNEFIGRIGLDKNILFIFGNQNNLTFVGNLLENTMLAYNVTGEFIAINSLGQYELDVEPTINLIEFQLDSELYQFNINEGQNIYYLIKHEYNGEVHIIHG